MIVYILMARGRWFACGVGSDIFLPLCLSRGVGAVRFGGGFLISQLPGFWVLGSGFWMGVCPPPHLFVRVRSCSFSSLVSPFPVLLTGPGRCSFFLLGRRSSRNDFSPIMSRVSCLKRESVTCLYIYILIFKLLLYSTP